MLLMSVQEVSNQLARAARDAGYRGAVTKSSGGEVLKGIEALLRDMVPVLLCRRRLRHSGSGIQPIVVMHFWEAPRLGGFR